VYAMATNEARSQQMQAIHAEVTHLSTRFGDLEARVLKAAAYDDDSIVRAVESPPEVDRKSNSLRRERIFDVSLLRA
jgi:hypothetical protein